MGRDAPFPSLACVVDAVSIHAPTRGATYTLFLLPFPFSVSIHAPTRGATFILQSPCQSMPSFNPRAHAGRDNSKKPLQRHYMSFNPRAHAGRDEAVIGFIVGDTEFQSTRPRGARLTVRIIVHPGQAFQSTRPRGARLLFYKSFNTTILKLLSANLTHPFRNFSKLSKSNANFPIIFQPLRTFRQNLVSLWFATAVSDN